MMNKRESGIRSDKKEVPDSPRCYNCGNRIPQGKALDGKYCSWACFDGYYKPGRRK